MVGDELLNIVKGLCLIKAFALIVKPLFYKCFKPAPICVMEIITQWTESKLGFYQSRKQARLRGSYSIKYIIDISDVTDVELDVTDI